VIRFRLPALFAAGAVALLAASLSHPAGAAPKVAPSASPSPAPAPSPTATPESLDVQIPRLEAAIKKDPTDKDSMTLLATDYFQINRPDEAAQLTQKLLQGGTKNAQVYLIDGLSQAALGNQNAGIASMEQASDLEPTNMLVLSSLTQMYLQANRPADAERVAKRALTFNATSKDAALNYGYVFAAEKKYDEARAQFENAAELDPKDPHPLVLEARTYEDANALALAMPLFDRALAIDPKNLEALVGKAELASAQHDVKTSVATYNIILGLAPDDAGRSAVTDQIALAYARENMKTEADQAYRQAIDSYGGLPAAHLAYGDYLSATKDNAGALREWNAALGPNRDNPDALARLGQAAATTGDLNGAVNDFKRLTEVQGSDPRSYLLLGQAYVATKNWNGAHDAFKSSYNLAHTVDALAGMALADEQSHNYSEAAQIYEALEKNPDLVKQNPGLLFNLATVYKGENQTQKAKDSLTQFLTYLKPGTPGYTQVKQMIADLGHGPAPAKPAPKPAPKPTASAAPKH
jgi:tetratricopeptide (TPR) repeat protein